MALSWSGLTLVGPSNDEPDSTMIDRALTLADFAGSWLILVWFWSLSGPGWPWLAQALPESPWALSQNYGWALVLPSLA